ncbi:zinc-dependent alcohol dehydrogenase family protein [Serratia sp. NPDC078593]|uniref:zinc-dependent alcohol dehydrogenase family protein n=1 Tax=unclassified Serratia (in: enterobacteria) TaxID=2647522 RepID=UPI0037D199DD
MASTMQRWIMNATGRQHLQLIRDQIPQPGPHQVRVKVTAVALNYRDKMLIEGLMPIEASMPFTPASDMAGEVDLVGACATRFRPGDRVISNFAPGWIDGKLTGNARMPSNPTLGAHYQGVLAEYIVVDENWLSAAPQTLDDTQASTLPTAGLTAWFALIERGQLHAGQTVLVQGTGGVALFALQIAKAHGAQVYITSASEQKLQLARQLGADYGINRLQEDWVDSLYALTQERGIDHVIDTVGGTNLANSLRAVAIHGRISVIGSLAGIELAGSTGLLLLKSPVIQGIGVGHRRALEDLVRAVDANGLQPVIDQCYQLDQLPEALAHLDRGAFGKIVITLA